VDWAWGWGGGKVRKGGKVPNLVETFAHLDFGVFSAWETGKVLKWLGMCVYPFCRVLGVLLDLPGLGRGCWTCEREGRFKVSDCRGDARGEGGNPGDRPKWGAWMGDFGRE